MKNWGLTAMYIVVMLLGFFELYRTFRFYKWDKKAKQLATAPVSYTHLTLPTTSNV